MLAPNSQVERVRLAIGLLLSRTEAFLRECPAEHVQGSIVAKEMATSRRSTSIATALSLGNLALELAADHLSAFAKIISLPTIETFACFSCIRSMLETAAVAAWVLDPAITSNDRIARVFSVRFDAIDQQIRFAKSIKSDERVIQELMSRLRDIEAESLALGFREFRKKDGAIYAIGIVKPTATEMIKKVLDDECFYRLLSAVAHGHHWAVIQLGFKDVTEGVENNPITRTIDRQLEKTLHVEGITSLALHGFLAFARLLWNKCQYHGWDLGRLVEIFDNVANQIQSESDFKFWRSAS